MTSTSTNRNPVHDTREQDGERGQRASAAADGSERRRLAGKPTRRRVIQVAVAAAGGVTAAGYIKPTLLSIGIPKAYALISGPNSGPEGPPPGTGPGTNGTPGTPATPDDKGTPGTNSTPGTNGTPGTPATPNDKGTPGTIGTPGTNGTPGTPATGSPTTSPGSRRASQAPVLPAAASLTDTSPLGGEQAAQNSIEVVGTAAVGPAQNPIATILGPQRPAFLPNLGEAVSGSMAGLIALGGMSAAGWGLHLRRKRQATQIVERAPSDDVQQ